MYIKKDIKQIEAKEIIENGGVVYVEDKQNPEDLRDRGIGKTTAICAYAIWSGKKIIVETARRRGHLIDCFPQLKQRVYTVQECICMDYLSSLESKEETYLLDDVKESNYKELRHKYPHLTFAGFVSENK